MNITEASSSDFWLFGYGSLIWKPPPSYDRRVPGYIKGYVRRFWQASEDHRGTPEAPGRVVTLVERSVWEQLGDHHDADDFVWGMAYHIESSFVEKVKEYLDIREINGYSIRNVYIYQADPSVAPIRAIVYIGTPDNPQFVPRNGGIPNENDLAHHIYNSRGPSGENRIYLYELYHSLEGLCPESKDNHIKNLFRRVAILEAESRVCALLHADDCPTSDTEFEEADPVNSNIDTDMAN